jgi:hypothetical protein
MQVGSERFSCFHVRWKVGDFLLRLRSGTLATEELEKPLRNWHHQPYALESSQKQFLHTADLIMQGRKRRRLAAHFADVLKLPGCLCGRRQHTN